MTSHLAFMKSPYYILLESLPFSIKRRLDNMPAYIESLIEEVADSVHPDQARLFKEQGAKDYIKLVLLIRVLKETIEAGIFYAVEAERLAKGFEQEEVQIGTTSLSENSKQIVDEKQFLERINGLLRKMGLEQYMSGEWRQCIRDLLGRRPWRQ